jgi:hypothetical protein
VRGELSPAAQGRPGPVVTAIDYLADAELREAVHAEFAAVAARSTCHAFLRLMATRQYQ